jgi:hypothetical protein
LTTTGYPPPPVQRQRRRGGVVWPLILIFIGTVFLLQNAGYLPPNFWLNLWRLWPLVLVLIGVEILLAHRVPWPALAAFALVVLVVGAVASNAAAPQSASTPLAPQSVSTDLGGASQAAITLRFGAGSLNVGALASPQPNQLAQMDYQGPPQLMPQPHYAVGSGGVGQLDYEATGGHGGPPFFPFGADRNQAARLDLSFAPGVPIASLVMQTGATDDHIDLSSLRISTLDFSIGAASAWIRFPEAAGLTTAHISGGASTITLEVPDGVAAQIQTHGGLSTLNVDQSRFPLTSDGVYRSSDYATAQNRLDLTIETGVTTIQVN